MTKRSIALNWPADSYLKPAGTFGSGAAQIWLPAGIGNCSALAAFTTAADTLYLLPEPIGRTVTIANIGILQSSGNVGGNCRIGIYNAGTPATCFYPTTLVYDSGAIALVNSATGPTTAAPAITLQPGVYWFCVVTGIIAALRGFGTVPARSVMGFTSALGTSCNGTASIAQDEAAVLPTTLGTGAVLNTVAALPGGPVVFYRLTA